MLSPIFLKKDKLDFDLLLTWFKECLSNIKDQRASNASYSFQDICLSAFAMFFLQDPSFLAFQKRMQKEHQSNNASTIFGIEEIPTDNQIRNILDNIPPDQIDIFFETIFNRLNSFGWLNDFRFLNDQLLIPIDGTCYHHSTKVKCDNCLTKVHKKGYIRLISDETSINKDAIKKGKEIAVVKTKQQLKVVFKRKKIKLVEEFTIDPTLFLTLDFNDEILYMDQNTEQIYSFINNALEKYKGFIPLKKKVNKKESKKEVTSDTEYYHAMLTPIIASPNHSQVISLAPEHITNLDGGDKQDCERNAAKRWLDKYGDKYGKLNSTILGDDLYACEPICAEILDKKLNFIFTCKEDSHKSLYEFINFPQIAELFGTKQEIITVKKKEIINTYRYLNNVPIKKGDDSLKVNWFEIISTDYNGKKIFYGTYITSHKISDANVADLSIAARSRWKVENENNNSLKTKGYHLEHNFGHGKQYLSMFLATLNIIAFLFHSVLELYNHIYQKIRKNVGTKVGLFEYFRQVLMHFIFNSWKHLMEYIIKNLKLGDDLLLVNSS